MVLSGRSGGLKRELTMKLILMKLVVLCCLALLAPSLLSTAAQERLTVAQVQDVITRAPAPVKVLDRRNATRVLRQMIPQYK